MKRKCIVNRCNNKINILAYWFGLRHCEKCDMIFKTLFSGEEFLGYDKNNKIIKKYYDGTITNE